MEELLKQRNKDRISVLHDDVLLHILSFLDMEQVLKTSVLSKRWQYIWTFLPKLTFQHSRYEIKEEETRKFVTWVHKMLFCNRNKCIEKLDVSFDYFDCFASNVDDWAQFASDKEVKDLRFNLPTRPSSECYSLPQSLYCNKFLMNLRIYYCKLVPKLGLSWTRLKSLSMVRMELNESTIALILSGSPMLEYLKFCECCGFENLNINSKSLRELLIVGSYFRGVVTLEISAPKLQYLHILGDLYAQVNFRMLDVSSLLKVELDFNFHFDDSTENKKCSYLIQLIECFHHVPVLELGGQCIQVLALLLEKKNLSSPLVHLKCLKVNAMIDQQVAAAIINLLKCSPNIEKLFVRKPQNGYYHSNTILQKLVNEHWESGRFSEKFLIPRLKTFKCRGFKKLGDAGEFTLNLLQVILENAGFLDFITP